MTILMMVLTILLPAAGALALKLIPGLDGDRKRLYLMTGCVLLADCVLAAITALCGDAEWTFLRLADSLPLMLKSDMLSRFFCVFFTVMWTVPVLYSYRYMEHEGHDRRYNMFYLLTLAALNALAFSGTAVTMYLNFEMMTLLSVALVLHEMTKDAIAAGLKYLIYSIAGATMGLLGIFYLATNTNGAVFVPGGSLDASAMTVSPTVMMIILLITIVGFGTKAGMFPMHAWLPTAHPIAPAPASAVLSGVITKAGVLCILRIIFYVVGAGFIRGTWLQQTLLTLSLLTVFMGSMMAFRTDLFKKRLAYSTVSQVSYVLMGIFMLQPTALTGSLLHIIFHSTIKTTLFLAAGAIIHQTGKTKVSELEGIGKQMPVTIWCFTLASLGLIGIPPTGGFISKWNLAQGALASGTGIFSWLGPVVLLISALLTAGYLLPVTIHGFFPGKDFDYEGLQTCECHRFMLISMILCVAFVILGGMFPGAFTAFFGRIASSLM